VEFEWDETKNQANIAKHGLSFATVESVFDRDDCLETWDDGIEYDERRYKILGPIISGIVAVIYTERHEDTIRIISARRATITEIVEWKTSQGHTL